MKNGMALATLASLKEQLNTGIFEERFPKPRVPKPERLDRKEVELLRVRRDVRERIAQSTPMTLEQKINGVISYIPTATSGSSVPTLKTSQDGPEQA